MPLSEQQRAAIVAETKSWIGTPYRGWSCLKGCGVDCGQLIYGVYRALNLLPIVSIPTDYSLQLGTHRDTTEFYDRFVPYFRAIEEAEIKPGDVAVYNLGRSYNHAAIVIEWPGYVIHAWDTRKGHGVIGGHGTKEAVFHRRPRTFFTLRDEFCARATEGVSHD